MKIEHFMPYENEAYVRVFFLCDVGDYGAVVRALQ